MKREIRHYRILGRKCAALATVRAVNCHPKLVFGLQSMSARVSLAVLRAEVGVAVHDGILWRPWGHQAPIEGGVPDLALWWPAWPDAFAALAAQEDPIVAEVSGAAWLRFRTAALAALADRDLFSAYLRGLGALEGFDVWSASARIDGWLDCQDTDGPLRPVEEQT